MPTIVQRSFSGGEITPALYARVDTQKHATGVRTCRNNIVMRHGGCSNRPGTEFVGEVKDSTKTVRLIPFVFNATQTYVLEFGDQYMRVHRSGAQALLTAQNISGITNANPAVLTYAGADTYANGDEVYVSGIVGPIGAYLNGRNFKVAGLNAGANTFELNYMNGTAVNSTSMGAYTSGGTIEEVYTITTPYVEADLSTLQFVQSADVITITHPSYAPRELSRSGHTTWTLSTITFAPGSTAPSAGGSITGTAGANTFNYAITAIASETYEESLAYTISQAGLAEAAAGTPHSIAWTAVGGAVEYNVYKELNGIYGLVGVAGSSAAFYNPGITPDATTTPPTARNPFGSSDNYPSTVAYIQQRLTFGNTNNDPEKIWCSRSGYYKNFTVSRPSQDDDALTFEMVGSQVNQIRHIIDLGKPIVFTSGGEWALEGSSAGILVPAEINPKQYSFNGSSTLKPIVIGGTALYVQARGSIVRDLGFDYQVDGYRGNDLTIFSAHLFDGYTISSWAYQQIPHSIVWLVRDDGTLLGLTYVREHQVIAWHRHDFDGTVEQVCSVPEGEEDALYLVIKRTINGATKRYVERMTQRRVDDIVDAKFMDCLLSYDGRNTDVSLTMTMSEYSGGGWAYTSTVTLTASASYFESSDVGNEVHLTGSDGSIIRFEITSYVSATVVRGRPNRTVPAGMRAAAISDWAFAVDDVSGLWHIEGKAVSVFADGYVVASPNNDSYTTLTVTNGAITLDRCYGVIHVGLPYTSDIETLDINSAGEEPLDNKHKLVSDVTVYLEESRGMWVGSRPPTDDDTDPLEGLYELKIRSEESYDSPVALTTDTVNVQIRPEWNSNGRVFIRQVDPLPLSVLAVAPAGLFPAGGE